MSPKVKGRCRCWTNPPSIHEGHYCFAIDAPEECHDTYSRREPKEPGDATVLVLSHKDLGDLGDDLIGAHALTVEAGITYRQLDYWTRLGYLTPITPADPGSGRVRVYPVDQVSLAREMGRLIEAGLIRPMSLVHHTAAALIRDGHAELGDYQIRPRQETA